MFVDDSFVDDLIKIIKENNTENQGKNKMNVYQKETSKMNVYSEETSKTSSQSVKNIHNYGAKYNDILDLSFDIDSDTTYLFKMIRYETLYQPFLFLYHFIDEKLTNIVRTQCLENNMIRDLFQNCEKFKENIVFIRYVIKDFVQSNFYFNKKCIIIKISKVKSEVVPFKKFYTIFLSDNYLENIYNNLIEKRDISKSVYDYGVYLLDIFLKIDIYIIETSEGRKINYDWDGVGDYIKKEGSLCYYIYDFYKIYSFK